jgi:NIMA (never in mitosis gene a)-related kinase
MERAVFLIKNGAAKLGDLNVSKIAKKGMLYTQTGTPYYASPEVWKDCPYDTKSDIWSLGCVLYEAAALRPPFKAQSMEAFNTRVQKGIYPKIPSIYSEEFSEMLKMLLQVNPELRPSCDEILKNSKSWNTLMLIRNCA